MDGELWGMSRCALFIAALAVAAGAVVVPNAAAAPAPRGQWVGEAPMIAGTSRYDRGEWIYNDFVFDDYGADTGSWGQPNVVSLAGTTGDARYPEGDQYAGNAADIVEVRARRLPGNRSSDLQVRVTLQTLVDDEVPAVWVATGEDERIFTARNARVDADENTISFTLPGVADGDAAALTIGAGLHDGDGGLRAGVPGNRDLVPDDYTTGGPTDNRLFDVAFNSRDDEPRGAPWNEDAQSAALNAGDLSAFTETIDLSKLERRVRTPVTLAPGYSVRLFESRQDIGEGIKEGFPQFGGTVQPYALWIPDSYRADKPATLFLNMHSLDVHHNQYRGGTSATYKTFYEQMGDDLDAIVITPLGRGPDGWYRDEALVDTLEAWADAVATFPNIDPDRTIVSGYSMGGYGTYRLSTLMPDSFASALSVVGPPTDGIWTGLDTPADEPYLTYPQLENTRNVPFWITQGVLDELVPVYGVTRQAQRLGELGHEYRYALHPAEDHLSFSVKDSWSREASWFADHPVREEHPSQVTLRVRPASLLSEDKQQLAPLVDDLLDRVGAEVDGGYWVHDVVVAAEDGEDVTGVVDLTSGGVSRQRGAVTPVQSGGADGPSPYVLTGNDVTFVTKPRANVLTGTLANVTSLTVDLAAARFTKVPVLDLDVDRPVTITFVRGDRVVDTRTVSPAP